LVRIRIPDPCHWITDPDLDTDPDSYLDPDPALFVGGFQDATKKLVFFLSFCVCLFSVLVPSVGTYM
jgi:hypothetical protein